MPKPGRTWIALDIAFWDGDGAELSTEAQSLFLRMICRCKFLGTDGCLTEAQMKSCAGSVAEARDELLGSHLVDVGPGGGYIIPSYCAWNGPMAGEAAETGALGAHNRWHVARGIFNDSCCYCTSMGSDGPNPDRVIGPLIAERERRDEREEKHPAGADPLLGFDKFWGVYPKRNGKRLARGLCEAKWKTLSLDDRHAAYRGAVNYAAAIDAGLTLAKDPIRFLKGRVWEDWQEPAVETPRNGNGAAHPRYNALRLPSEP